jgi:sulfur relay (sulfurtransferase) complex TusBCD TusD component (DsrE family)
MVSFCIFIGSGPYSTERPYTALRFAYTALLDGNTVKLFLFEDAILCATKNQNPANIYNIGEWVGKCMSEEGFEIAACGVCMKARGIDPSNLMEGIKTGTMELAVEWTKNADKQLFF